MSIAWCASVGLFMAGLVAFGYGCGVSYERDRLESFFIEKYGQQVGGKLWERINEKPKRK